MSTTASSLPVSGNVFSPSPMTQTGGRHAFVCAPKVDAHVIGDHGGFLTAAQLQGLLTDAFLYESHRVVDEKRPITQSNSEAKGLERNSMTDLRNNDTIADYDNNKHLYNNNEDSDGDAKRPQTVGDILHRTGFTSSSSSLSLWPAQTSISSPKQSASTVAPGKRPRARTAAKTQKDAQATQLPRKPEHGLRRALRPGREPGTHRGPTIGLAAGSAPGSLPSSSIKVPSPTTSERATAPTGTTTTATPTTMGCSRSRSSRSTAGGDFGGFDATKAEEAAHQLLRVDAVSPVIKSSGDAPRQTIRPGYPSQVLLRRLSRPGRGTRQAPPPRGLCRVSARRALTSSRAARLWGGRGP